MAARLDQRRHRLFVHFLQHQLGIHAHEFAETDVDVDQLARRFDSRDLDQHAAHRQDAHQILPFPR